MPSTVRLALCIMLTFAAATALAGATTGTAKTGEPAGPPAEPLAKLPYRPSLDTVSMDASANACSDFYQYACGGWMAHNPIPSDQASWDVYGKLYQDNQQFLWGILQSLNPGAANRTPGQQKIGDYFAACMDEAGIENRGVKPLAPLLTAIDNVKSKAELPALIAHLELESGGSGYFFDLDALPGFTDSSQVIAFVDAGGLGMPDRDYYTDKDAHMQALRKAYVKHVERTFVLLGENGDAAAHDADVVMRLESRLARASLTRVQTRDPYNLNHPMSSSELHGLAPSFDWAAYFDAIQLRGIESVNVTQPRFFKTLDALLAGTELADIKTYLRWHASHNAAPYLTHAFRSERFDFYEHQLRGTPVQKARWKTCVEDVDQQLGEALGQEYVARTFGPKLKDATVQMTRQIEDAMRNEINQLEWMSESTKAQALSKLDTMVNKIGYPDRWRDYSSVAVRPDDYFGNWVRAGEFEARRILAKIGRPKDRAEWDMTPQTVNAYYDPQMNDINFPAGVLQPPLYDATLDDAPNYGDTGGTIGHELTHAFDDTGSKFDSAGNLKNWWTAADAKQFAARTTCVADQYARYTVVDDIHINSRLTLGEDVADLGGLILAHIAWHAQIAGQTPADRDHLTAEQRFFVGYAQWACENMRPENLRLNAKTDAHSPARYRVNGVVVNVPEFRKAFACPAGSAMVSPKPCRVW